MSICIKRVYEKGKKDDGLRILVDRLWPRGIRKQEIDLWLKQVAPSPQLRKWFNHEPEKFNEFRELYIKELTERTEQKQYFEELAKIVRENQQKKITLLFAAKDIQFNHVIVLKEMLEKGDFS